MDFNRNNSWSATASVENVRAVMQQVYVWMFLGLTVTAVTAVMTAGTGLADSLIQNPLIYLGAAIVELGMVWYLSANINRLAPSTAVMMFFAYSALNGFTLSLILLVYTSGSIASAFISTSALFGAMSIYGATTKTNLAQWGNLLFMALIGLIIAMIVNIFLRSSAMEFVISFIGVLLFTALTAYDTQRITKMASHPALMSDRDMLMRVSLIGALHLYLDFINLFLFMLRLMNNRR